AGTEEAPGQYFYHEGHRVKTYRGMGIYQENAATSRYFSEASKVKVAQGVSGDVQDKGSVTSFVPYLYVGLQHSFQDIGVVDIPELWEGVKSGEVRFELRTASAQVEGGVHGLNSYTKRLFA
ncbi:hypothetical protein EV360DRAFT_39130, partial [Lentinula raphanica]